jgi:ribonuclease HIII
VLEVIVSKFKLHYPQVEVDVGSILSESGFAVSNAQTSTDVGPSPRSDEKEIPFPYIGIDESGKGDYFGPLVVVAVWLNESIQKKLEAMGVRDSKKLSDKKCQELAVTIRELCRGKFAYTEISPKRYNSLYEQFKNEGKNLNHLLAWGHARSLENLLSEQQSQYAIADQFGDEKYIESKLMEKGRALHLVQTHKAERYMAVAAASILARDIFLSRLEQLGKQLGLTLPKGASQAVDEIAYTIAKKTGAEALGSFAKLHFKTTSKVIGKP